MAQRTTIGKVKAILGEQYDTAVSLDLQAFIDTAVAMVDWLDDTCDTAGLLTASQLERIEAFLSSHYYAHADQLLTSKSTGAASGSFQGQTQMGFKSTQYGQSALELDVTGCLASLAQEAATGIIKKMTVDWLGTEVL